MPQVPETAEGIDRLADNEANRRTLGVVSPEEPVPVALIPMIGDLTRALEESIPHQVRPPHTGPVRPSSSAIPREAYTATLIVVHRQKQDMPRMERMGQDRTRLQLISSWISL